MMNQFARMGRGGANKEKVQSSDTSEIIEISGLALLKMIKHAKAGVPLEVMGIMLGQFVDDYTISVQDVFAMPQVGTSVSVEAIDPAYQQLMVDNLNQTGRTDILVGWYHSHPGLGCWLSGTDVQTAQSYESQHQRCVSLVIDPIQSVRGQVVLDAFRCIPDGEQSLMMQMLKMEQQPRHTTSNIGYIAPINQYAQVRGLDETYYSINTKFKKTELETQMLLNLYKQKWTKGMKVENPIEHSNNNLEVMKNMSQLSQTYATWIDEELKQTKEQLKIRNVGKLDPKKHLEQDAADLIAQNVDQILGSMINTQIF